uniref:CCHC-type domain-containing protein n=1 Tax=Cacopsylla melanoneura TaxID=428564 RepID=A0A8D8XQS4_9HEMI
MRTRWKTYSGNLNLYETRRGALEEAVAEEELLNTLVPQESEDLFANESQWLLEIEAKLVQYQSNRRREKEDIEVRNQREREDRDHRRELEEREHRRELEEYEREREERQYRREQEERADRREREEMVSRIRLEELDVRRMEIQSSSGTLNRQNGQTMHSNLPKIELLKFSGKIEEYQGFWDNFSSLVDSKEDIDENIKFHYLKNQLTGEAASLIAGIRITNENYGMAKQILNDEYGSVHLVNNKLFTEIKNLRANSNRTDDIHELYRQLEIKLKMLENQGVCLNDNILSSILFQKLPFTLQQNLAEEKRTEVITVKDIRERMHRELQTDRVLKSMNPELSYSSGGRRNYSPSQRPGISSPGTSYPTPRRFTTESLVSKTFFRKPVNIICVYCGKLHYSDQCDVYVTVQQRREKLQSGCYICLKPDHFARECNADYVCYYCKAARSHHRSLCNKRQREGYSEDWKGTESRQHEVNRYELDKNDGPSTSDNVVTALSHVSSTDVFMQTASVEVYSKASNKPMKIRALFDTASSHSYITTELYRKLKLENKKSGELNVFTFGVKSPNKLKVSQTEINVLCDGNENQLLEVLVVPTIVGSRNVQNYDQSFLCELDKNYKLSDTYLFDRNHKQIDLLIGIDYYAKFINGKRIMLDDNLFLWESQFGYILSGTKSVCTVEFECRENTALFVDVSFQHTSEESRGTRQTHFRQGKVCSIEPRVGKVVLIKEDKLPRARWPHGIIRSLNYSRDGKVRSVDIELPNMQLIVRSISLLFPLEY